MKFLPGQSGNPAGRPLGALNKKTLALEAAYEAKAEAAVNDIMERAKSGDRGAMRLCMERAVPAGRHRRFGFALPRVRTPEDAEMATDVVMDGLADGVLSLGEVEYLLRIVERLLHMIESVREAKSTRDIWAKPPSTKSDADEDEGAVQKALAGLHAAIREVQAQQEVEQDEEDADALYFPVNPELETPAEAVEAPPPPYQDTNESRGGSLPAAHPPTSAETLGP
ncbi:MAG: hypothetical protein JO328_02045 [Hyphomicrobiales bacterium]|nr:hypothetical protein [Hyphomicrobiales bacterium]MBV8827533.1 hypothetical protein [Hyphomicrobiales bacterium]